MCSDSRSRILFLNRSYWPDAEATGQLLTELCEDLSEDFQVTVLCGQPNQNPGHQSFVVSGEEVQHGVLISRVKNSRFNKRTLLGKLINFLSFLWNACWRTRHLEHPDIVICETDPFPLPLLAAWIRFRTRCKVVFYLQDIYPDIAVAVGKTREGFITRCLRWLLRACYRRADSIVVLSKDMKRTIQSWGKLDHVPVRVIPNWIDTRNVQPQKTRNTWRTEHGFSAESQFLVMYSGNLGLSQDLSIVVDAARRLQDCDRIQFVFVGEGASKNALMQQAADLENVSFLPYQPRERLSESLSAADLHLLPIRNAALNCLMPSKLYGILASGTAVLAIAPADCELAEIIENENVGINVPEFRAERIERAIRNLSIERDRLSDMGRRGRLLAERKFDRRASVAAFRDLLNHLSRQNPQTLSRTRANSAGNCSPMTVSTD